MPAPRRKSLSRRGWNEGHFVQLRCGWDFTGDGWGMLSQLSDDDLAATIEDMLACWRQHRDAVMDCGIGSHRSEAWIEQYARDPHALFVRNHKARSYMEFQQANGGYRPYDEFERQYAPPEAANA